MMFGVARCKHGRKPFAYNLLPAVLLVHSQKLGGGLLAVDFDDVVVVVVLYFFLPFLSKLCLF